MQTRLFRALFCLAWIGTLLLSSCRANAGEAVDEPTVDTRRLATQAARTIQAGNQMTELALPPTRIPTQQASATGTTTPTFTQAVATATMVAVATITKAAPPYTATSQPEFTATVPTQSDTPAPPSEPVAAISDRAQFVSMSPGKGSQVKRGSAWEMRVKVKNTGEKTWTIGYNLGYVRGEQMHSPDDLFLQTEVKPGETYGFAFNMEAPQATGLQQVTWALRDDAGQALLTIDFEVLVVQ